MNKIRVRFFGRIQDGFIIADHTDISFSKKPLSQNGFSGVKAHFQPVRINVISIKLKFCEKFTTFCKFPVH